MRSPGPEQGLLFAYAISEGAAYTSPEQPEKPKAKQKRRQPPTVSQTEMRSQRGQRVLIDLPDGTTAFETLPPLPKKLKDCQQAPTWDEELGQWVGGICPKLTCQAHLAVQIGREGDSEVISIGGQGGNGDGISLSAKQHETRQAGGKMTRKALDRKTTELADRIVSLCDALPSVCVNDYLDNPDLIPGERDAHDDGHMTLQQIGTAFTVSREAIRKQAEKAMGKAQQAEGFAEWVDLVRERSRMKDKQHNPVPDATEHEFADLNRALDRALDRIKDGTAWRKGDLIPSVSLVRHKR